MSSLVYTDDSRLDIVSSYESMAKESGFENAYLTATLLVTSFGYRGNANDRLGDLSVLQRAHLTNLNRLETSGWAITNQFDSVAPPLTHEV